MGGWVCMAGGLGGHLAAHTHPHTHPPRLVCCLWCRCTVQVLGGNRKVFALPDC